jgi:hypothetical protein
LKLNEQERRAVARSLAEAKERLIETVQDTGAVQLHEAQGRLI